MSPPGDARNGVEVWNSRWGLLLAGIGMAVGTGNIWRFPRVCAKHGGGTFIVAWLVALFVWSIPLLITELVMGRQTRKGPIGAFRDFLGKGYTWMGSWICFVTLAIMCYYAVVTGWCLRYLHHFVTGTIHGGVDSARLWTSFVSDPTQTLPALLMALLLSGAVIAAGVQKGIERVNKILLPGLFVMLGLVALRALSLDGAGRGLSYLFSFDAARLADPRLWLEAFSQSAWSTGAGWGLLMVYATYMKKDEDVGQSAFLIGLGNNCASLVAALAVIPTIGALASSNFLEVMNAGNTGLTFIWLARLFPMMTGGRLFGSLFFLTLVFAALSSLVSMLELGTRVFMDWGWTRRRALAAVTIGAFAFGSPSALSQRVFENQDWVWGVGLLVSGFFTAFAAWNYGCRRMRNELINVRGNRLHIGRWWDLAVTYAIPLLFVVLTAWWFWQGVGWSKKAWWHPLGIYTPGTVFVQWLVALGLCLLFNDGAARMLKDRSRSGSTDSPPCRDE